ncbi:eCIS core domain-containing protein [Streptomyces sp. NPDC054766]
MRTSGVHAEQHENRQATRGPAPARQETSGSPAVPPPLTADGLRAAQRGAGNAAVTAMIARRARPAPAVEQPDPGVHEVLRSAGKPLAAPVRQDMESRLGSDFSDVRLHTGAAAARSARAIGARAYTSGSHVVLGAGGGDRHTLAHELTHVVQQRNGPVSGTDHGHGLRVSDPRDSFEREAESTARRALSGPVPVARAVDEHAGTHRRTGPDAVQRLVGFEAELSVPSFGPHPTTGLNPVDGRAPAEELGGFFHGGLPYGATVMSEQNLTVLTDHNSLARRVRVLHAVLSELSGADGTPVATGQLASSMSNLEYVTAPFDEMAPGSDAAIKQVAERIEEHVAAIFQADPVNNLFGVPGSPVAGTGTPLAALQQWLGPALFGSPKVQSAIKGFQSDIKWEMYIQATLGVLPSGLPSLYSFQAGVDHESRRAPGKEHIADAWRDAAATINRMVPRLRSEIVPGLLPGLEGGDQEALTGTLALGLSYAVGSAMVEAGVRGPTASTKNAVPFLLKLANLGGIRNQATTDVLREKNIGHELIGQLAVWMHKEIPETGTGHWQQHLQNYPSNTPNPTDPVYGRGHSGVENTAHMLHSLLTGNENFPVIAPGKALPKADEPNAAIVPHIGGQKGAPVEMRWLTKRATSTGHLWGAFKVITDEARKANLATVPTAESERIWKAAQDLGATPASATAAQGAEFMEMDQ